MAQRDASRPYSYDLSKIREQALEKRVTVQNTHARVKNLIRHFDDSRVAFMKALQDSGVDLVKAGLKEADQQLRTDSEDLKAAMEELRLLHFSLSGLDYELFNKEQNQPGGQNYLDNLLDIGLIAASTVESKTILPAIPKNEREIPPLLDEYFDMIGDIKNLRERLDYDLVSERAEKIQERERRFDQDETLSTTDSEFEASLIKEREELEAQLNVANSRAKELHAKCLDAGLDTDPTSWARESDDGSTASRGQSKVERWLDQERSGELPDIDPLPEDQSWSTPATPLSSPLQESYVHHAAVAREGSQESGSSFTLIELGQMESTTYVDAKADEEFTFGGMDGLDTPPKS